MIEGMRLLEEQREKELIPRPIIDGAQEIPSCRSWLDVNGHMICSEEEFWRFVGEEQKEQTGPVVLPARCVALSLDLGCEILVLIAYISPQQRLSGPTLRL